jgi:hypothetical protein
VGSWIALVAMSFRERGRKNLTRPSGTEFGAFGVAVADVLGSDLIVTGKVHTLDEMLSQIDAVTIDSVMEAAHKYLQPENLHFAAIGPLNDAKIKSIEDLLRK